MLKICKYVYHIAVKYDLLLYDLVRYTISYTITICYLVFYTRYNRSFYPIAFARPRLALLAWSASGPPGTSASVQRVTLRNATQGAARLQIRLYGVKTPYNALYAFI